MWNCNITLKANTTKKNYSHYNNKLYKNNDNNYSHNNGKYICRNAPSN